jgi:LmbE family N-acetylglucosaminyl deacetylase
MKILVISAHPDDMEIGMGGTIVKLAENNHIISVILTDGRRAPNPSSITQEKMAEIRKQESKQASEILGIQGTIFCDFESLTNQNEATQKLVEIINIELPAQIFTLHPELDRHSSHRAAGNITLEAVTRSKSNSEVWAYEVWGLFHTWDRIEDVTIQMDKKLKAIGKHQSQLASIPYAEGVAGLNRWRAVFADPQGTSAPTIYAEVFLRLR